MDTPFELQLQLVAPRQLQDVSQPQSWQPEVSNPSPWIGQQIIYTGTCTPGGTTWTVNGANGLNSKYLPKT